MPTLFLTSSITLALQIKMDKGCPHIHFVQDTHNSFLSALCWVEALNKGGSYAREHGFCVVSYDKSSSIMDNSMTSDELSIILSEERKFLSDYGDLEIWEQTHDL